MSWWGRSSKIIFLETAGCSFCNFFAGVLQNEDLLCPPYLKEGYVIHDPPGLVSPFFLEGRQIVQKLCFSKSSWNESINEDVKQQWQNWKCELKSLKNIKLNRCYKPAGFGKVVSCRLYYFSDTLERIYGQATL